MLSMHKPLDLISSIGKQTTQREQFLKIWYYKKGSGKEVQPGFENPLVLSSSLKRGMVVLDLDSFISA